MLKFVNKNRKSIFTLVIFLLLLWIVSEPSKKSEIKKIPSERYIITGNQRPNFREAIFEPLDFLPNEEQTVYVNLQNKNPIESVSATVTTDKKINTYQLKLFEGNEKVGTWRASWRINDTHNYTYSTTFKAISQGEESRVDLTFRPGTKRSK